MQTLTSGSEHSDYPDGYTNLKTRQQARKGRRCCCVLGSKYMPIVPVRKIFMNVDLFKTKIRF